MAAYGRDETGPAGERVSKILTTLGVPAIPSIAALLEDPRWYVQRDLAGVLGRIGTAAAVPPLQSLLRGTDPRVMRAAVAALAGIDDPAAARALHTVLRAAAGEARTAVITALSTLKNPRVVPLLTRLLQDCEPFAAEHLLVIDMLGALGLLRDDRAVASIAGLARRRRWLAWRKTTRLRRSSLVALARIGSPKSQAALDDLARTGDFFLKRMARRTAATA
jgi:HEAT repeat protein